jgi:RecA/RadA recombinase
MTLADKPIEIEAVSTGSLAMDYALGVDGVPRGRITEIFGPESAGKTTLAQHIVAEAQRAGGAAVYIDMEHKLDPVYMPALGLSRAALVFINQTRSMIGVMYGNPETTPGGAALRFYASIRMQVSRVGTLGPKGRSTASRARSKWSRTPWPPRSRKPSSRSSGAGASAARPTC